MSVNAQIHGPAASLSARYPGHSLLYPVGISAGTCRIGGWVGGSRAGTDVAVKRKF